MKKRISLLVILSVLFFCLNFVISMARGESPVQNSEDSWTLFKSKMDNFEKEIQVYLGVSKIRGELEVVGQELAGENSQVRTFGEVESRVKELKDCSIACCRLMMKLTSDFSFLFSQFQQLEKQNLIAGKKMNILEKQVQVYSSILTIQDKLNGIREEAAEKFQNEPKVVADSKAKTKTKVKAKRPQVDYAEFEARLEEAKKSLVEINQSMIGLTKDFAILFLQFRDLQKASACPEKTSDPVASKKVPENPETKQPEAKQVVEESVAKEIEPENPNQEPKQEPKPEFVFEQDIPGLWPFLDKLNIEKTGAGEIKQATGNHGRIMLIAPEGKDNSVKILVPFAVSEKAVAVKIKYSARGGNGGWLKVGKGEPVYLRDTGTHTVFLFPEKQLVRLEFSCQDGENLTIGSIVSYCDKTP